MDARQQLRAAWAYKGWVLLFAIAAAAAAYIASRAQPKTYKSVALVQVVTSAEARGDVLPADAVQSITDTYLRVADTDAVAAGAARNPRLKTTVGDVKDHVQVTASPGGTVFDIQGTADAPARAARYANVYADAFGSYVRALAQSRLRQSVGVVQEQIAALRKERRTASIAERAIIDVQIRALSGQLGTQAAQPVDTVQRLQDALPSASPASPRPKRDAVLAAIAALVLGAALAFARVALADRFRSAEEVAADLGIPLLVEIPTSRPTEPAAIEGFRRLRTAVVFALGYPRPAEDGEERAPEVRPLDGDECWTVLITAAERGAGKTYVTAGLARGLAAEGWRVVAVDADLRRPALHAALGVQPQPGLTEVLGERTVHLAEMVAQRVEGAGGRGGELMAIAAGTPVADASERLSSRHMGRALEVLSDGFDFVTLDSPPVTPVVDAVVLARYAHGVVIVVDARGTRRRDIRRVVETLRSIEAPILGFVFNRAPRTGGPYGYRYEPRSSRRRRAEAAS